MIKKKEIIKGIRENKFIIMLISVYTIVIVCVSILFFKIPQFKSTGIYDDNDFWKGILLNLNSGIIEFIIFSILLVWLVGRVQVQKEITYLKDTLEMNRNHNDNNIAVLNLITLKKLLALSGSKLNLSKLYFINNLGELKLVNTKLMGSVFKNAILKKAKIEKSDLKGARFINCKLDGISFENVSLKTVKFIDTKLVGATFDVEEFEKCEFIRCDMRNVNFKSSKLKEVTFKECNLSHANFKDVKYLAEESLVGAENLNRIKIDRKKYEELKTKYPSKFEKNR